MLAKAAVTGRYRRMHKQADLGELLSQAKDGVGSFVQNNPGLMATGAGALAGGAIGAGTGDKDDSMSSRALTGALAGGAIGGGGYLASQALPSAGRNAGEFFDSRGNKRKILDRLVGGNPDLVKQLDELNNRSPVTQAVGKTWDFGTGYAKNHPLLATLLAGDIGTQTLGTANRIMNQGRGSLRVDHLRQGLAKAVGKGGEEFFPEVAGKLDGGKVAIKDLLSQLSSQSDEQLGGMLRSLRAGRSHEMLGGAGKLNPDQIRRLLEGGSQGPQRGGVDAVLQLVNKIRGKEVFKPMMGTGFNAGGQALRSSRPGVLGGLENVGYKGMRTLSTAKNPFGRSLAGRLGPRAALYLGIPALAAYWGLGSQESANQSKYQDLMRQLSEKVR